LQKIQHKAKCGHQLFRIQMNLFTCGPYEPLEKCMTFKDIFPGLSRTKVIFHDFPRFWNFQEKNPKLSRTFQEACEPCNYLFAIKLWVHFEWLILSWCAVKKLYSLIQIRETAWVVYDIPRSGRWGEAAPWPSPSRPPWPGSCPSVRGSVPHGCQTATASLATGSRNLPHTATRPWTVCRPCRAGPTAIHSHH